MRQICLAALTVALLLTGIGCEPDYCSCSFKPPIISGGPWPHPRMWCPVGNPENDARILKLLSDRCIHADPFRPWQGNPSLQPISIEYLAQWECAEKLLFGAAVRGEITVIFGPPSGFKSPTTQNSANP